MGLSWLWLKFTSVAIREFAFSLFSIVWFQSLSTLIFFMLIVKLKDGMLNKHKQMN